MNETAVESARILIVDDEETNVRLLERILDRAGYTNIESTTDPGGVLRLFTWYQPDLLLLDLHMPHLSGFEVMRQLQQLIPAGTYLPILVLTADASPGAKERSLSDGAKDFLTKPFDATEVMLRVRNLLETRFLHLQLQNQNQNLEDRVRQRTQELEEAHIETFERLALAAEYRDDDSGQHTRRVGRTSAVVARELGLSTTEIELIERAAALHDVGKIGVSDTILLKPAKLTPVEFEAVKTHTVVGAKILSGSRSALLRLAEQIALTHHERWDGSGYAGLAGEAIPVAGRITAIADVFDALTHRRPYKEPWPVDEALAEIASQRGRQFDPDVVDAFLRVEEQATVVSLGRETAA